MNYNLFKKIKDIRQAMGQVQPNDQWRKDTRSILLMQVKNTLPKETVSSPLDLMKYLAPVFSFKWLRTPAFAIVGILLALFGGSLLSVSAAEQSLPGDLLYSVKLATEQARLALAKNPEDKVLLKSEFTGRRVDEMKLAIAKPSADRSNKIVQTAEVLKRDLHTLKQQLEDTKNVVSPDKVKDVAKVVDQQAATVVQTLQESKQDLSPEDKAKVSEAQMAASDTAVKALEVLADAHQQDAAAVTQQDMVDAIKNHNESVVRTIAETLSLATSTTCGNCNLLQASGTSTPASTAIKQVAEAQKTFSSADKLVSENKIDEAMDLIKTGTTQVFTAQKTLEESDVQLVAGSASSTSGTLPGTASASSTTNVKTPSSTQTQIK